MSAVRLDKQTKEEIIDLYKSGKTQKEIVDLFELSKSTVCYIVNPDQKEKSRNRMQKRRTVFTRKIDSFFDRTYVKPRDHKTMYKRPERRFEYKVRSIFRDKKDSTKGLDMKTRQQEVRDFLWPIKEKDKKGNEYPYTNCAITDKKVSVMEPDKHPDAMSFDHALPSSRGGANSLKNIQPLMQRINEMKNNDTNEEFFKHIKLIVEGPLYKEWEKKYEKKA